MISRECGIFRTNYEQDMALHRVPLARIAIWAFMAILLLIVPFVFNDYWLSVANMIGIAVIAALGLNILTGYAGQISIGHGALVGVGAYASAMLMVKLGMPFWISAPLAGVAAALVGAVFGIPSARIKGLYLAIATLAAQVIVVWFISRPYIAGTGATQAPPPQLLGFTFDSERSYFYIIAVAAILCVFFAENLFRTKVGRAFIAVRDQDVAAPIIGVSLFRTKMTAFVVSSFYAGLAGALWAHYIKAITYENFTIVLSIQYLAMIIIGGLGSIPGSILGAIFITLLPIGLRYVTDAAGTVPMFAHAIQWFSYAQAFLFGLVIVLFMIFEPEGLARIWRNVKDYFKLWPFAT